jgi:acetate CoA/acetoacetate CoA-transferase beta subunit
MDPKVVIAKRVAGLLNHGDVVNLGIGLPTLVANHIPEGIDITFHSENGLLGLGPAPTEGEEDWELVNAGAMPSTIVPGGMFFDSSTSFGIIRGGHVHATVLGAMEVDEKGNLANWKIPGKMVPGMGGAMDLVVGAKTVIIAMVHTQKGKPKILKRCTLPLTAKEEVDIIVTEMALIRVTKNGLVLEELGPGFSVEDVVAATEADLIISPNLKRFQIQ